MQMKEITYREAVREAMVEEMRKDEDIIFLGEDIGIYGGGFGVSTGMIEEFGPERILETPISEAAIAGCAAGAAATGLRTIMEIMFSDFITIAMDVIVNQAAKMRYMFGGKAQVPMVVRCPGGSGTGAAAQHSQSLEAWMCHIPGVKVVAPSTPADAKGLLKAAIRDNNPVIFYENKLLYNTTGLVPTEDYIIELGKANVRRTGSDITLITYGRMLERCEMAAEALKDENIDVEIIDLRTLYPMDKDTIIESVCKTGRALIVHEASKTGGLGGEISASIVESKAFDYLKAPVKRLAGKDVPIPYNPKLEAAVVPNTNEIIDTIKELVNR
ncbi:alpha-ketoacid dehydrogenase subunit beta [Intestinibacter bartlettii]|uniref:Alpha-ketoacid dehydrogenase subunit beta n=1 Tax=Intestinibacter bartlettii TaxID=261299 RepID=A0ABS6DW22_9FIRM|nr:alpha-ketoacid dehydrogenase subunit beta [Intestinibacter bartlettii]MBU5335759.1 alpha-ketoacid dehydrogenase subunit beta [Intestinibacter bartlettii]